MFFSRMAFCEAAGYRQESEFTVGDPSVLVSVCGLQSVQHPQDCFSPPCLRAVSRRYAAGIHHPAGSRERRAGGNRHHRPLALKAPGN